MSLVSNTTNPYAVSESKNSFLSPDLAYSADKHKLFTKIGYQPYTRNRNSQNDVSVRSAVPDSARLVDQSLISNAEKSPDVKLFLRSSNKADSSFYEKRISAIVNVRNKTQERQKESCYQSINVSRRMMNLRSEKKKTYFEMQQQQQLDESPLDFTDYQIDSSKTSACNRKAEYLSFYNTSDQKEQYTTFQNDSIQPILARRMLRNNKQTNQDNQQQQQQQQPTKRIDGSFCRQGDNSNKSCNSVQSHSFVRQSTNSTAISCLKPVKQSLNQSVHLKLLPNIKGIQPSLLMELYEAKCQDLRINPSKTQMLRFYDMITRSCQKKSHKLNLADFGLGDNAVKVIGKIIKYNNYFTSIDLKKNMITSSGLASLGRSLLQNSVIVHVDIGCNQISSEGAEEFFTTLQKQESITSINLANDDCYKHKNKIGIKGAQALGKLIASNQLITMIDLTDNALSQEAIHYIVEGIRKNPYVVYLNLSQNDLGTNAHGFNHLLSIFKSGQNQQCYHSLEELNVSSNQLNNKNIDELTEVLNGCSKVSLRKLVLSNNKFSSKGFLTLLQCLRTNNQVKLTHLYFDKADLETGSSTESINTSRQLMRTMTEYLKFSKTLEVLSLAQCGISSHLMNSIGKGLLLNEKLNTLILRGNSIEDEGLQEFVVSCKENKNLKLKILDFSSNKINDEGGMLLAQAVKQVPTVQKISLRDNQIGNEASDAFLFLVKEKSNLWKVQLDLNMIKYVTLVEIEKTCKKNKETVKKVKLPGIKQEINTLARYKDPNLKVDALDKQLRDQKKQIEMGFQKVVQEEEIVHDIINQGDSELKELEQEIERLKKVQGRLDDIMVKKDKQIFEKQREWERKLSDEQSMIEKCQEYKTKHEDLIQKQKQFIEHRVSVFQKTGEEQKLKEELTRIEREQEMMMIIMENYEKEIKRRLQQQSQETTQSDNALKKNEGDNALMHILKGEKEMFRGEMIEGKDGQKQYVMMMAKDGKEIKRKGSKKRGKSKKTLAKHVKGL